MVGMALCGWLKKENGAQKVGSEAETCLWPPKEIFVLKVAGSHQWLRKLAIWFVPEKGPWLLCEGMIAGSMAAVWRRDCR